MRTGDGDLFGRPERPRPQELLGAPVYPKVLALAAPFDSSQTPPSPDPAPLRVLAVTNDPACLAMMRGWPRVSVLVEEAGTLAVAVERLSAQPSDAVVVDAGGAGGLELLDQIRQVAPYAGVVALLDRDDPIHAFGAARRGAQQCLSKADLDARLLLQAVRRAVDDKWLAAFMDNENELRDGVFRALSPAIVVLDASGLVVLANPAWERVARHSEGPFGGVREGTELVSLLHAAASTDQRFERYAAGIQGVLDGELSEFRAEYCEGNGARWFRLHVDPLQHHGGAILSFTDIGEHKRTEERLSASERDFRRLLASLPDAIAVHRDGRLIYANESLVQALGYESAGDLLGRSALDLVHPEDRALVLARIRQTSETRAPVPPAEERLLRADGSVLVAEIVAIPVLFEGSWATLVVGRDLSQRRELTARMMQMDRMLSVGLLAAGLGHEINNPLSFVTANVDLALRSVVELERAVDALPSESLDPTLFELTFKLGSALKEAREALSDARQGGRRVQAIVRDLRTFARPGSDEDGPVDLERVLDAAINMAQNEIRHRARLVREIEPVPPVLGNAARLGQVFLNLLTNAAHAIGVGAAEENEIRIRLYPDADGVVAEISDTGSGIAPGTLPHIFEPFYTTKPVGHGTGLGLAICQNIVLSLGGAISVESELGRGTTLRVQLRAAAGLPVADRSSLRPLAAPKRSLRVLVVDDEPLIGRVVRRCLGRQHDTRWVSGGKEALEILLQGGERYDVVFLDVMMPEMTGIDVYETLERAAPEQLDRIVFLTGGAFTDRARDFLDRIPNQKLGKPFEPRLLVQVAEEIARSD
jgi:PAS domain S-box-containing protein